MELTKTNSEGIKNSDAAKYHGRQSDYGGGPKDRLSYSVLGMLMREFVCLLCWEYHSCPIEQKTRLFSDRMTSIHISLIHQLSCIESINKETHMKYYLSIIYIISLLFPHFTMAQPIATALSEEDLAPFCSNEMIWKNFNITPSQCMNVAVPCSNDIAKQKIGIDLATEKLYTCVFSKLGIELHD